MFFTLELKFDWFLERGKVIEGYNLSFVLSFIGISKQKMMKLAMILKTAPDHFEDAFVRFGGTDILQINTC